MKKAAVPLLMAVLSMLLTVSLTACGGGTGGDEGLSIFRASVSSAGAEANGYSEFSSISSGARYVAFDSTADNLVVSDYNGNRDIFIRDNQTGITLRVSINSSGAEAIGGDSVNPSISSDGRYVAFMSDASNLVSGDNNGAIDVFVCDTHTGSTTRVSVSSSGSEATGGGSGYPSISADGRYVAFISDATNLVPGDNNGVFDVFVRDTFSGTTRRVSVSSTGIEANGRSVFVSIDPLGRYVAFASEATNLVPSDTNGFRDVFVHDTLTHATTRVNVNSHGVQAFGDHSDYPSISSGGRYVAFHSGASNLLLAATDTNGAYDVFVHDRLKGRTTRVSVDSSGTQALGHSIYPSISSDGRYVAFVSPATNLVPNDTNGVVDVFVHDTLTDHTTRVNVDSSGTQAQGGGSFFPSISPDGGYVAFESAAVNLVPGDINGFKDVFVAPNK